MTKNISRVYVWLHNRPGHSRAVDIPDPWPCAMCGGYHSFTWDPSKGTHFPKRPKDYRRIGPVETLEQAKALQFTIEAAQRAVQFRDKCRAHFLPILERAWDQVAKELTFGAELQARDFQQATLAAQPDHTEFQETLPNREHLADFQTRTVRNPADGAETEVDDTRQGNPLPWSLQNPEPVRCGVCGREHVPGPCAGRKRSARKRGVK